MYPKSLLLVFHLLLLLLLVLVVVVVVVVVVHPLFLKNHLMEFHETLHVTPGGGWVLQHIYGM